MRHLVSSWKTKNFPINTIQTSREVDFILENIFFWGTINSLEYIKIMYSASTDWIRNLLFEISQQQCTVCGKVFTGTDVIVARMLVSHKEFYMSFSQYFKTDMFSIVHLDTCEDLRGIRNVL